MRFEEIRVRVALVLALARRSSWLGLTLDRHDRRAAAAGVRAATAARRRSARDVAPIIYAKCASCHRPGEVAPMSLITFKDVRPWAGSIREKVMHAAMPPWHADRQHGTFRNDQSLTQTGDRHHRQLGGRAARPKATRRACRRCRSSPRAGRSARRTSCSRCRRRIEIPATGEIDYQYFEVPTNFTEDRWMQAGEVRAGDRAHVHHIIVYVREPKPTPRPTVMTVRPIIASTAPAAGCAARAPQPGGAASGGGRARAAAGAARRSRAPATRCS